MAEAPPELLAIFSSAVLPALLEAEADDGDGVRDFAYDAAGDLFFSVSRTETYRNSPPLRGIRSHSKSSRLETRRRNYAKPRD